MKRFNTQLNNVSDRPDRLVEAGTELSVDAVEYLLQDMHEQAFQEPSVDPITETAQLLQALSTTPPLRLEFTDQLKHQLLHTYATDQSTVTETPISIWQQWRRWLVLPILPIGGIAAGVLIYLSTDSNHPTPATNTVLANTADQNTNTAISQQPTTRIDMVEFQKILADDAKARSTTTTNLDETVYGTLRRSATETLEADQHIIDFLKKSGQDTTRAQELHDAFAYDVSQWPAADAPKDAATEKRMIDAFVKNNTEWNKLMNDIINQLNQQYTGQEN
jgi:hypothetical protein